MPRRLAQVRSAPRPAPPPARAAAPMTAAQHETDATAALFVASRSGVDDRLLASCLAGMDACFHGLGHGEPTDRDRTLSRARRLYREALAHAVARRGGSAAVGPVRLRIDGYGDLELTMASGRRGDTRGPFTMEAAR